MPWTKRELAFLAALCVAATCLLLASLGNRFFWQDEGETALLARTILQYGVPKAYDGGNPISVVGPIAHSADLTWVLDPWLSHYAVAASFAAFGESEFAGRLPFALLGILCVPLTYVLAREMHADRTTAMIAAGLLVLHVPFLLLSRQCRYYTMAIFLSLLGLYGYRRLVNRQRGGRMLLFCAAVLLFHSCYAYSAILIATVIIHGWLFHRPSFRSLFLVAAAVAAVDALWILGFAGLPALGLPSTSDGGFALKLWAYLTHVFWHIAPVWLVALPIVVWVYDGRRAAWFSGPAAALALPLIFLTMNIAILATLSSFAYFRYVGPSIPLLCIFLGAILRPLLSTHPAVFAVGLVCFTLVERVPDYLYEITHDYDGPIEGIVKYLRDHGKDGDVVAINYDGNAIRFYMKMRVVSLLYDADLSPALEADWLILRQAWNGPRVAEFLQQIRSEDFTAIPLVGYPDVKWSNRPSPYNHHFRTVTNERPVVIYQRIREAGPG
jgi:hypothetical protein